MVLILVKKYWFEEWDSPKEVLKQIEEELVWECMMEFETAKWEKRNVYFFTQLDLKWMHVKSKFGIRFPYDGHLFRECTASCNKKNPKCYLKDNSLHVLEGRIEELEELEESRVTEEKLFELQELNAERLVKIEDYKRRDLPDFREVFRSFHGRWPAFEADRPTVTDA